VAHRRPGRDNFVCPQGGGCLKKGLEKYRLASPLDRGSRGHVALARTTFFGAFALAGFDLADCGGAEVSLSGRAAAGDCRSRQLSSSADSGHALAFESTAGSLLKMPSGNANQHFRHAL